MPPPPVTPAPSRFLVPAKRPGSERPQGQTPNTHPSAGPNRFHATPRFPAGTTPAPLDQISAEPFSPDALPIPVRSARSSRGKPAHDIIDEEASPTSSRETLGTVSTIRRTHLPEPIEFASSYLSQTPVKDEESPIEHVSPTRSPKRRRISIASSTSSMQEVEQVDIAISSPSIPASLDGGEETPNNDPILPDNTQIHSSSPPTIDMDDDPILAHIEDDPILPDNTQINSSSPSAPAIDIDVEDDDQDDGIDYRDAILPHNTQIHSSPHPSYSDEEDSDDGTYPHRTHPPDPDEMITSSFNSEHNSFYPDSHPNPLRRRRNGGTHDDSQTNQPTFHPAPRFGHRRPTTTTGPGPEPAPGTPVHPPDTDPTAQPPLDISPHRTRTRPRRRHLPGGMASELRSWLLGIKEDEENTDDDDETPTTAETLKLTVTETRREPPGMTLVAGRVEGTGAQVRAILAGEGEGGEVREGGTVEVMMPAWEMELGGRWVVGYRWGVVGGEEGAGAGKEGVVVGAEHGKMEGVVVAEQEGVVVGAEQGQMEGVVAAEQGAMEGVVAAEHGEMEGVVAMEHEAMEAVVGAEHTAMEGVAAAEHGAMEGVINTDQAEEAVGLS
ncbi:hypothetical protein QBC39DRAFT_382292 [Podospora conica]|nr:hypothetical protein QBC39DRAFT_382292 [Schizothecium conicum]